MRRPGTPDPQDNIRLLIAVVISLGIMFAFTQFYEKPRQEERARQQQEQVTSKPAAVSAPDVAAEDKTRAEVVTQQRRIPIKSAKLTGTLSLTGARIDDLMLNEHRAAVGTEKSVQLLEPSGTKNAYYVESGWIGDDAAAITLPDNKTVWNLAPGSPAALEAGGAVMLQWNNGQGLLFERRIELDENYLFTVTQKITNKTDTARKFHAFHLLSRHSLPEGFSGFFILHEGPIVYAGKDSKEIAYADLAEGEKVEQDNVDGWLGISDKYWYVGLFPDPSEKFNLRVIGSGSAGKPVYQADIVTAAQTVEPGHTIEDKKYVFVGAKNVNLFTAYAQKYGFKHPDLIFDFGMWYMITKPFFYLLHFLMQIFGNVGLAILAITVVVRAAVFPLASKSFRSMAAMKKVQPQLKELQEKYGKDREKLQIEIFELYKKENVNPFSGCWPLLIQIPIFFALYKVILLSVELRHAPFWGWIHDLSAPDPTNLFTLFGLINWTPPSLLHIGIWPLLFCFTMIVQKRLSPPMPDPMQEQLQNWFPYIITIMLAQFASGLVIYWTWSNLLGILQQYYILKKMGGQEVSLIRGHSERRKPKKKSDG